MNVDFAGELNPEQLAAVQAGDGPVLVIAAAGTGKTRTLIFRVAWLAHQGIEADRMLLLTFTNKAAKEMVERINKLIRETQRELFSGVGKPEPLRHALSGFWSRRITDEHRMVYRVEGNDLLIAQLRFHY